MPGASSNKTGPSGSVTVTAHKQYDDYENSQMRIDMQSSASQLDLKENESFLKKKHSLACWTILLAAVIAASVTVAVALMVHFLAAPTSPSQAPTSSPEPNWLGDLKYRIPREVQATHYTIYILPNISGQDPKQFTNHGRTNIHLTVLTPTNRIVLHGINQFINVIDKSVRLYTESEWNTTIPKESPCEMWSIDSRPAGIPKVGNVEYVTEYDYIAIRFDRTLSKGERYVLQLAWNGQIIDELRGFYYSSYVDPTGQRQYLTATHFSSIDARRAFPCMDEPDIKATFDMRMLKHQSSNLRSLSNTNVLTQAECTTDGIRYRMDVHKTTVKSSTYLVAYTFSTHGSLEMVDKEGRTHRVWSRPDMLSRVQYGLNMSAPILENLEQRFGIKYDYDKLDHFSIPEFSAGAMENWGLITYREERLFYDQSTDPINQKQRVAMIIAHEIAHKWFGNLVSITWFTDLWITEGFARYLQYVTIDALELEWQLFHRFIYDVQLAVMKTDSLANSRPLSNPVENNVEVRNMFDTITYDKGAAVIHMIRGWLGSETFWRSLRVYLKRYSYGNSIPLYLGQAWEEQAHADGLNLKVVDMLNTWVYQNGYPVVRISVERNNQTGRFVASVNQRKFRLDSINELSALWKVPVTMRLSDGAAKSLLLEERGVSFDLEGFVDGLWYIGNDQRTGFYRVNYDEANWHKLTEILLSPNYNLIEAINRGAMVDDGFNLARTGDVPYEIILNLTTYLSKDAEYLPWSAAISNLDYLEWMSWNNKAAYQTFTDHWREIIRPIHDQLGWEIPADEKAPTTLLRVNVIAKACSIDLPSCVQNSTNRFKLWSDDPAKNPLQSDLRQNIMCTAIRGGLHQDWESLFNVYQASSVASDRSVYINALACSANVTLLQRWLNDAYKAGPKTEFESVYLAIARNIQAKNMCRTFYFDNWKPISTAPGSASTLRSIISAMYNTANTNEERDELASFVQKNEADLSHAKVPLEQALENIKINIVFVGKYLKSIVDWIQLYRK